VKWNLDSDGDPWYDLPKDWSLDKAPKDMNTKELSAAVATALGCTPEWYGLYLDWTCTCDDGAHAGDSQCSAIADYANDIRWARRAAEWLEGGGYEVPKVTATPRTICERVVRAARAAR
jgi:hypothetical protein